MSMMAYEMLLYRIYTKAKLLSNTCEMFVASRTRRLPLNSKGL